MKIDIEKIQIIALADIDQPNWLAEFRKICRWYSKEFNTPLYIVETDLSPEYILRHYYESLFFNIKNSQADDAAENYENLKLKIMGEIDIEAEEEEDDEWADEVLREIRDAHIKENKKGENPNINDDIDIDISGE